MSNIISDDVFEAYAQEQEAIARAAQNNAGSAAGFAGAPYEVIQWTGLEPNRMKLIRAVGGPPDSKIDNFTARTCRIARIIGDDGRQFRCILPERSDDPSHILWRIMARVNAVEWVNGKKVNIVESKHPDIFNIVNHNGLLPGDKRFVFDRGWAGRQVLIMNVIDREQMEWHRQNKHTMLLSRSIGEGPDGTKYPEEGVPSWGFSSLLANIFKYYKSWEKYDIGITRTSIKEVPYKIINACKYIDEVPEYLRQFIVDGPLTEEEASWERYDLSKLYKVTYYTKIYNKLRLTIGKIDAVLGTRFLKELEDLVDKEKAELAAQQASEAPAVSVSKPVDADTSTTAVRARAVSTATKPSFDTSLLKGWNKLKPEEQASIGGIVVKDGRVTEIQYTDPNATLLACPSCRIPAPESILVCPNCGLDFC